MPDAPRIAWSTMDRPALALLAGTRPSWIEHLDRLHLLTPLRVLVVLLVAAIATIAVRRVVTRALSSVFERAVPADRTRAEARHRALSSALRARWSG